MLFVTNHGFGGAADLNVLAALAALEQCELTREVTILCHQIAWTLGLGKIVEAGGAQPATHKSATEAFKLGHHVLVAPGGDIEAAKSFADRNKIVFSGRRGFARIAAEQGVPIVPIVTAGAGESLFVLWDGQQLARALHADTALRMKVLPVSVSLPWGFSIGVAGLLPYLPIPTKLVTSVLDPMWPTDGETADAFGDPRRSRHASQAHRDDRSPQTRVRLTALFILGVGCKPPNPLSCRPRGVSQPTDQHLRPATHSPRGSPRTVPGGRSPTGRHARPRGREEGEEGLHTPLPAPRK